MITDIPQLPKQIVQYINRSNELEKVDPIISYFCKLFAVEEILDKSLHLEGDDISKFAVGLLDDIESTKNGEDEELKEIINDKEASISYVLAFSNKIFQNGLNAIKNHQSSKATALSFLAFVNFIDLLKLWKEDYDNLVITEEITKKIKYAKFHAARIIKTLKKGEDPNDYDPPELELKSKEDEDEVTSELSPTQETSNEVNVEDSKPPQFIDTVDDDEPDSLGLPPPPKSHPKEIDESTETDNSFSLPEIPKFLPENDDKDESPKLPSAPKVIKSEPIIKPEPKVIKETKPINIEEIIESSEIFSKAQKHAKFAISALNYEDTDTALKQLKDAIKLLEQLKASSN